VLVSDFNYQLPEELIAQEPLSERAGSRLLHLDRASGKLRDGRFCELPDLLRPDDLVVFNNTRVFPARLYGRRSGQKAHPVSPRNPSAGEFLKGETEVLLTRQVSQEPNEWSCLVRPGRKIGVGERLFFGEADELQCEVLARGSFGERRIRFAEVANFPGMIDRLGHIPLPPYIGRLDRPADRERYQTVYARERGSVAAPTAGLHFTPEILRHVAARNIATAEITLHVGLGTFQPVRVQNVRDHQLHHEAYCISSGAADAINRALDARRRVVAIGTTTVRALEHAWRKAANGKLQPGNAEADLFIYPGFEFHVVGALLTNFHLPQSSLLMLVSAFGGKDRVLETYRHAVEKRYRFYSYGDCMFLE
jgi:S-adenosylmethionine:tRNA ribosyltransferase-isomerase